MHMIDLRLRPEKLIAHAQRQGHNDSRDEDLGYATHGWLKAALGEYAPTNFRLLEMRNGGVRLLGYAPIDIAALREHAHMFAEPAANEVCDWESAASKQMGTIEWRTGQRLGFECRLCPVIRGDSGERDAFLAVLPDEKGAGSVSRVEAYRDWTAARLHPAAELDVSTFRLKAFRLVSTFRQASNHSGPRQGRRVVRPDSLTTGTITIRDPDGFRTLLARGVGRHRAFGFGMLLLRPP